MSRRLSEFYGLDVYSLRGEYVGKVEDVVLNLEKGMVMSLCLKPLRGMSPGSTDVKKVLREESISYTDVSAVNEVVLIKNKPMRGRIRRGGVMEDEELVPVSMGKK